MKFYFSYYRHLFYAILMGISSSCELLNPKVEEPGYLTIDNYHFSCDSISQGGNSSKITDAWVYVDDKLNGIYELPARFPIIADGSKSVKVKAGIKFNGIANDRIIYPFYSTFDTTFDFTVNKKFTLVPRFKYKTTTKFIYLESFEGANKSLIRSTASDTSIQIINAKDPAGFNGSNCGAGFLTVAGSKFDFITAKAYPIASGQNVILELDYSSNQEFVIGLIANTKGTIEKEGILNVNSSNEKWKKIYVNLASFISAKAYADYFTLFLRAEKSSAVGTTKIYFDNIKIINE